MRNEELEVVHVLAGPDPLGLDEVAGVHGMDRFRIDRRAVVTQFLDTPVEPWMLAAVCLGIVVVGWLLQPRA